ncbi:serine/threonine-protein phosphatase 6 regulatory ankyrin repeat subunit B-like isoform X3 [Haliotis cracherodii]|uniref:serine/threonine-protein phosphatase 6 regulatory ankyrin repeat subunit B-like isoform X3 n=1 Tax=Haliotis cracherodii TaxID=6455 RepID=UPI0039EAF25B
MLPYVPNTVQSQSNTERGNDQILRRRGVLNRTMANHHFTQSVFVTGTPREHSPVQQRWMGESCEVVPRTTGGFQIYQPNAAAEYMQKQDEKKADLRNDLTRSIEMAASKYKHNIRNPEMKKMQIERSIVYEKKRAMTRSLYVSRHHNTGTQERISHHESLLPAKMTREHEFQCSCKEYHSHPLVVVGTPVNKSIAAEMRKREKVIAALNSSTSHVDTHDDPRNIFWSPELSFHPYKHGDSLVDFPSLWLKEKELKNHLKNPGIQVTMLRGAVPDLCKLAVTCGPVRLLRCLIDLSLIRVDQQFDNGSGMLHLACLARNNDAVQYLINTGISPKLRDKNGSTADEVCMCPSVKRQLPQRYLVSKSEVSATGHRMLMNPSLQDKDNIFSLAKNPKFFDEIQKKLQIFDFNVNTECDSNGDFLLHIACKGGLSQLPLVMALVKIQGADVELCNADGMTSLMLAATAGNCVLCDVLMCLFGADPNKPNPNNGRSALHYATEGNHRKSVECLIRRGADVNIEDHDGRRPDDIPSCQNVQDDCKEVIDFNRMQRLETLSEKVRKGDVEASMLLPTDLCVVADDGYTLLMIAAIYNRGNTLSHLLAKNKATIDAQHTKTGMTALSIASQMGNVEAVEILLKNGANPSISDMESYLPLHHAVLNNHEAVVDLFLDFFPDTYVGLHTAQRLIKKSSIHHKVKSAWERRQEEVVMPKLIQCALNGNAEDLYCVLDEGDSINLKSGSGNWPLYLAVENGHLDVVKLLFEKGGDIRKRHSSTGATVLHRAAKMGHYKIVDFLIQFCRTATPGDQGGRGKKLLDINAVDAENKTALQLAAEKGFSQIVLLLLQHGATTAILDARGALFTCPEYEGVRIMIETHREKQTKLIMKCVQDKSKKALAMLQKSWLPCFDHNLRTKLGDTPLMVACRAGRLPTVKFLLESAVYSKDVEEEDLDDSDVDSGVNDPTRGPLRSRTPRHMEDCEDGFAASGNFSQSVEVHNGNRLQTSGDFTRSMEVEARPRLGEMKIHRPLLSSHTDSTVHALLRDVSRPKGLFIYHDDCVSHVSAVNLFDGCTSLHRTIEGGDNVQIVKALLGEDATCLNVQNDAGLSPLHLACTNGRKKTIEILLARDEIDLNCRTLDGHLAEEMTSNKSIIKLIQKARLIQTGAILPNTKAPESPDASKTSSIEGTNISFDQLQTRYETLKQDIRAKAMFKILEDSHSQDYP